MMNTKIIVVAMSGGVDSSVAAALLKDRGFDVIGITMQINAATKAEQAEKVAQRLGIHHYILNFENIFKEKIIANFCKEYKRGRTPNPCIRCNKYIKFAALLTKARELGADYIATGHYARIEFDKQRKRYLLKKGIDSQKEQSYFLYALNQKQLKHALLPLGDFTKKEVIRIAKEKDLPVKAAFESQEICFISNTHYGEFIRKNITQDTKPGPIVNKKGEVIGRHRGIIYYTIGQRKGIGIADKEPLYVISINRKTNTVVVGKQGQVYSSELIADNLNFIYFNKLEAPIKIEAKVRYLHPPASARLIPQEKGIVKVKFDQPQCAITPGQAVVFYSSANGRSEKSVVVGGGRICSS